jgi:hypothetical protein
MSAVFKVERVEALSFMDQALRNVDLQGLDEDFVDDVAGALETFLRVRGAKAKAVNAASQAESS